MRIGVRLARLAFVALICVLISGCLFRPTTVTTRQFVLASISTNEPLQAIGEPVSIGIGEVKMPAFLMRDAIAVRSGASEIEYLDDALWAERLDQSFQQTVALNLSKLLPADKIYLTDWGHDQAGPKLFISVQQFDVDTAGRGTLIADWRIKAPDNDVPIKSGETRLVHIGGSSRGHPEVIAATLSDLTTEFSRELAQAISTLTKTKSEAIPEK
jgi:uncharacterized lipoprotein YmbA